LSDIVFYTAAARPRGAALMALHAQARPLIFRRFTLRRKASLLVTLLFITALAALEFGCAGTEPTGVDMNSPVSFDVNSPKIKERLGADDGYAMAILYGADIHGSLETCG
jgi:hypothetical protein